MIDRLRTAVAALLALAMFAPAAAQEPATWTGVDRIVVFGDLHGDLDKFEDMLRQAKLVNRRGNWIGGTTHLVQLGDVPDRGDGTRAILDRLMKLEKQAERAGGRVHSLIGNHEAMNIAGDLRYVSDSEYAAFTSRNAERLRDLQYERTVEYFTANPPESGPIEFNDLFRAQWDAEHPLGWVEHRQAWAVDGDYGSWVAAHDTMIKINDTLFVHGGVAPTYAGDSRTQINDGVRAALALPPAERDAADILWGEDSPLWYRGFAYNDEAIEAPNVEAVLARHDVARIVVGHTPVAPGIVPRFGGRVILADVYEPENYPDPRSFLVIEDGETTVVHRGSPIPLHAETQDGVDAYADAVAALEPEPARLLNWFRAPPELQEEAAEEADP